METPIIRRALHDWEPILPRDISTMVERLLTYSSATLEGFWARYRIVLEIFLSRSGGINYTSRASPFYHCSISLTAKWG